MGVEVYVDQDINALVFRILGKPDAEEVAAAYAAGFDDPAYKPSMDALWDISGIKLSQITMTEVRKLTQLLRQYSGQRGADYRAAISTNNQGDYQLLRLYTALFKLVGQVRVRVFNDPSLARNWIANKE